MHLGLLPLGLLTKLFYVIIMSPMHDRAVPHVQQHIITFGLKNWNVVSTCEYLERIMWEEEENLNTDKIWTWRMKGERGEEVKENEHREEEEVQE